MKVIFLDRDGVINEYPGDSDYVKSWDEFHFLPKVNFGLKRLSDLGFKIFIISNQAGVSKGIYSKKDLDLITSNMLKELKKNNVSISGVYYCTHTPQDNCHCRKPKPGLLDMAVRKLKHEGQNVEFSKSYFIGDSIQDVEAGHTAGVKTILVFSGKERPENRSQWQSIPDFTANNLSEAVAIIQASLV